MKEKNFCGNNNNNNEKKRALTIDDWKIQAHSTRPQSMVREYELNMQLSIRVIGIFNTTEKKAAETHKRLLQQIALWLICYFSNRTL